MGRLQYRKILGETVRELRRLAGLSQETLAERADLSAKFIGEVERGTVNISVDSLFRIARALNTEVSKLTRGF